MENTPYLLVIKLTDEQTTEEPKLAEQLTSLTSSTLAGIGHVTETVFVPLTVLVPLTDMLTRTLALPHTATEQSKVTV